MPGQSKSDFLYEEAQRTLNQQIKRSEQISDRAHRLLRTHILTISAVGAVLSAYFSTTNTSIPSLTRLMSGAEKFGLALVSLLFGIFTLLFAIFALVLSIFESKKERGPGGKDIQQLYTSVDGKQSVQRTLLHSGYIDWIEELSNRNYKRQKMLNYSYALSAFSAFMFFVFVLEVV